MPGKSGLEDEIKEVVDHKNVTQKDLAAIIEIARKEMPELRWSFGTLGTVSLEDLKAKEYIDDNLFNQETRRLSNLCMDYRIKCHIEALNTNPRGVSFDTEFHDKRLAPAAASYVLAEQKGGIAVLGESAAIVRCHYRSPVERNPSIPELYAKLFFISDEKADDLFKLEIWEASAKLPGGRPDYMEFYSWAAGQTGSYWINCPTELRVIGGEYALSKLGILPATTKDWQSTRECAERLAEICKQFRDVSGHNYR